MAWGGMKEHQFMMCMTGSKLYKHKIKKTYQLRDRHKIKEYDVAVCMYHDQALIPIKTLYSGNIINTTLGLDFIRTSPDHGTALDIAGKKKANPNSLILAINKAEDLINKKYVK